MNIQLSESLKNTLKTLESECPVVRLLNRGIRRRNLDLPTRLLSEFPGNYFSFREREGMISFLPEGRDVRYTSSGLWERKGRQEMKPAKWLRSMLSPRALRLFKDSDIANFSEKFRAAELAGKVHFRFTSFTRAYSSESYIRGGESFSSCMHDEDVEGFYLSFGARVLVAEDTLGKLHGRAVVWKLDTGETFIDRVYATGPEVTELFFSHAKQEGWIRKAQQGGGNMMGVILPDGAQQRREMSVSAVNPGSKHEFIPYLDTFASASYDWKTLSNHEDGPFLLRNANGDFEEINPHEGEVETLDGDWIPEDEAINVDGDYYHQDDERITYCDRCCEYVLRDGTYTVETSRNETLCLCSQHVTEN